MPDITITEDTETYFDAVKDEGLYTWNQGTGITVSDDVKDAIELLHEVGAGATISAVRQAGRLVSISITTSGDAQILASLQGKFNDAKASHDGLEEKDGYCP